MTRAPDQESPYLLFMLALSLLALGVLAASVALPLSPPVRAILNQADGLICILFFADFVHSLVRAPNRWQYLYRWGWLDLLSSIPSVDFLRISRVARVFRIVRVFRGVRATKVVAAFLLRRRAECAFLTSALVALLLVVSSSIAILQFEADPGGNIKTAEDALWWAVATITTVGYGDRFPVTTGGRIVAGTLMVAGVGLVAILSGFVAVWFLRPGETLAGDETEALRAEVRRLTDELQRVKNQLPPA